MKKRIFSFVLALCLVFGAALPAFAAESTASPLKFDENGEFRILHLCDCQDGYPAKEKLFTYINYMLDIYKPHIVVLGGDNTVCLEEDKDDAIKELVTPFVERGIYFTLVFGNHDDEQGVDKETLLAMYQKHGGEYCLAYDVDPALSGCANHNLPVYASKGEEIKFNLWMLDTGTYVYDETGEKRLGYDSVRDDQVRWYAETSRALEAEQGKKVPSLVFQHMIVQEIYDVMFPKAYIKIPYLTETYGNRTYSVVNPDTSTFKGHYFEAPSPGVYNYGETDTMISRGDVLGILVGHDHVNSYEANYSGMKLINTPGASFNAYGNQFVRGSRLITIKEDNPWEFESEVITVNDLALSNDEYAEASGIGKIKAFGWKALEWVHLILKNISAPIAFIIY